MIPGRQFTFRHPANGPEDREIPIRGLTDHLVLPARADTTLRLDT